MSQNPAWWTFPFKPIRVDSGIFDRIDCSLYTAELKYDGWRAVLIAGPRGPELWTREKRKIEIPDSLSEAVRALKLPEGTVLDGEIWNPEKRGGWNHAKGSDCKLTFWDVVKIGSSDLRQRPIEERREALRSVIQTTEEISIVEVMSASKSVHDAALESAVSIRGSSRSGFVHGVVLKKSGSPRRDSNVRCVEHADWLKIVFDMESAFNIRQTTHS